MFSRIRQPGINKEQQSTLNNKLINLIRSQPHGLRFYANPGEGASVLARALIERCGNEVGISPELDLAVNAIKFLNDYFALDSRFKRRMATRKLAIVISNLIVNRKLKMIIDYRYKSHDGSGTAPIHTIIATKR